MKYDPETLVAEFATRLVSRSSEAICARVTRAVVRELSKTPTPMSDITGMKSLWQDICIELQYEHSVAWDYYEGEAELAVHRRVDALDQHDLTCVWLETDRAGEWLCKGSCEDAVIPADSYEVACFILSKHVFQEAIDSKDKAVRAWIDDRDRNAAEEESTLFHEAMEEHATAPEMTTAPERYVVMVDDNFHYMDEDERRRIGEFSSLDLAIDACKRLVDQCLDEYFQPGMDAATLLSQYKSFGDDPFIKGPGGGVRFSAWDYAAERCDAIVKTNGGKP